MDLYFKILEALPKSFHINNDWHTFWVNKDEIMCPTETHANILVDFFENLGVVMLSHMYDDNECLKGEDCYGWWSVYPD